MSDLLTSEEIDRLYGGDFWRKVMSEGIGKALKAQDAKTKKGLVERLEQFEICDPYTHELKGYWLNIEDMEALKKEVEDG